MSGPNVYVYVISEGGSPHLKIGLAYDVRARLAQIQGGNPRKLTIEFMAECGKREIARQVEYRAHFSLSPQRLLGEWFDCPVHAAVLAVVSAQKWVRNRRGELGWEPNTKRSVTLGRPLQGCDS